MTAGLVLLATAGTAEAQLDLPLNLQVPTLGSFGVRYGCDWLVGNDAETNNTGYLDTQATYRTANIPVTPPAGAYIRVKGKYPKARYFGFQTYDGFRPGNIIDRLPDAWIQPDSGAATDPNPAVLPDSNGYTDSFTLKIVYANVPTPPAVRAPNTIYAGIGSRNGAISKQFGFRLYFPNTPGDKLGGVELARLTYVGQDGSEIDLNNGSPDQRSCNLAQAVERFNVIFPTVTTAKNQQRIAFKIIDNANTQQFYPNPDSNYLQAEPGSQFGDLVVVRQRNQVTPLLPPLVGDAPETRYWSLCAYSVLTSSITGCIADTQMKIQNDGYYVTVISTAAKRPPLARPENGYNWLPYGAQPNGLILLRQILASPTFAGNYERALAQPSLPLSTTLGSYAPEITYCSRGVFNAFAASGGAVLFNECRNAANRGVTIGN